MYDKAPIIITECPRSGAGIISGIINLCGGFGGDSLSEKLNENLPLRDQVIRPYLTTQGIDITGQYPLKQTKGLTIPADWHDYITNFMVSDGYRDGVWFVKSPEAALMWPVWNAAFPDAKWVIVRRRTGDIIHSCKKTAHMDAFKDPENLADLGVDTEDEGWLWMARQYEDRFVEMITAGLDCKVIWPQRMVWGNFEQVHQLLSWTGLRWNPDIMGFVDKRLEKSRK